MTSKAFFAFPLGTSLDFFLFFLRSRASTGGNLFLAFKSPFPSVFLVSFRNIIFLVIDLITTTAEKAVDSNTSDPNDQQNKKTSGDKYDCEGASIGGV